MISISHSVAVWPLNPHRRGWWNATPHEALWILGESDPCFMSSLSAVKQARAHSNIAHTPAFISFTSGSSSTVAPPSHPRDFHMTALICWALLYLHWNTFFISGKLHSPQADFLWTCLDVWSCWNYFRNIVSLLVNFLVCVLYRFSTYPRSNLLMVFLHCFQTPSHPNSMSHKVFYVEGFGH